MTASHDVTVMITDYKASISSLELDGYLTGIMVVPQTCPILPSASVSASGRTGVSRFDLCPPPLWKAEPTHAANHLCLRGD